MTLLVSIANWQVPEWLNMGAVVGTVATLFTVYVNTRRLGTVKFEQKTNSLEQIKLLSKVVDVLNENSDKDKNIAVILSEVSKNSSLLTTIESTLNELFMKLANFVNDAFQTSGLSDQEKLELRLKFDDAFKHQNLDVITDLRIDNEAMNKVLIEREQELKTVKEKLIHATTKIKHADKPTRKTRRV